MKKNIYKLLATIFAMVIIVTSPATTLTTHAIGFNPNAGSDGIDRGTRPSSSSSDSNDSYGNGSNSSSESSSSNSYDNDSSDSSDSKSGIGFNDDAQSDGIDHGVKPAKNPNDVIVRVTGGQPFHNVMNKDHTSYQVYHCGDSKVTFEVTDSEGNTVTYKTVTLEQGEDKLWYECITISDEIDTKGLAVNVTKGDATYLSKELGVSGVKINGTVVLSTIPSEPVQVDEDSVIGHRYCSCGASFDIRENGGIDKDAWNAHMREHAAKGESARYTDK